MAYTLVTFLGRPQRQGDSYRTANYRFPDGAESGPTAFFGLALAEYLNPDNIVILGTSGSMWGGLVSDLIENGEVDDEVYEGLVALLDAENDQRVTPEMLEDMTDALSCAVGRNVEPHLIPFGEDALEQYEILQVISDAVPEGDVSFDLTHGLRHLGMVGFLSAFMLERVRRLDVCSLWYGALDMTDQDSGITPVLKLDGLNGVRRWVDALNRFDASGDYGVFTPLLIVDGVSESKAEHLKRAAFHERTLNLSSAAQQIRTFLPTLDHDLGGASKLFQTQLRERLEWARCTDLAEHQRLLALEYLERNDFIRAAVFGWEALATRECSQRNGDINSVDDRRNAIEVLEQRMRDLPWGNEEREAFFTLRGIRNALAHGNPPQENHIQAILGNADLLEKGLNNTFQHLLNGH